MISVIFYVPPQVCALPSGGFVSFSWGKLGPVPDADRAALYKE